ncbi:MAG: alanine racemase [Candidatus Dormibacteraeota bacterium]|nr:alanine racemase [Candidatus Dormibacteraeota bacterium]MBV9524680.1 alanine racemase [Candidatus Dormibacteraeota bacterium]
MTSIPGSGLLRWAEVDVDALRHNAATFRRRIDSSVRLLVMVKSNGYGHGAEIAARAAVDGGADWLGVYTPDEALALRAAGFSIPLLVAGWSPPATHAALVADGIDVTVFDAATLSSLADVARAGTAPASVHLKLDSGLGRIGVRAEDVEGVVAALRDAGDAVRVAGIFTHYADAEGDEPFTREQHARFMDGVAQLRPLAPDALLHTSGSAAILNFPEMHHDLVRLGIAYYGYAPKHAQPHVDVRVAMSVFARVVQVKSVSAGESVGYGRTWRSPDERRIATAAIGYGQGLPRALSNRGVMSVRGERCPIVGTVSMDQTTIDVTGVKGVAAGDEAMFYGERDGARLGADEVAATAGTIAHEILCGTAAWVPRLALEHSPPGE